MPKAHAQAQSSATQPRNSAQRVRALIRTGALPARASGQNDDMEPEDAGPCGGEPFRIFSTAHTRQSYDVYLSSVLGDPSEYDDLCQLLRHAGAEDTVNLFINTAGGDVMAGMAIIQAMRDSSATITTILNPHAFSMGALMFLAGDKKIASKNAILMFHNYSSGLLGKGNEQAAEVAAINTWFEGMLRDICSPFLSKKEQAAVMQGRDLYFHYDAIQKRFDEMAQAPQAAPVAVPAKAK